MKWTKFLIVILGFIATVFLIDRLYAPIPTWADKMIRQHEKTSDHTGIIIIGNSHSGAIRQRTIGDFNVMNFSYSGMELEERFTLLKKIIQKKGSLRYVLMAMDYDQVGHKTSDGYLHNMLLPYSISQQKGLSRIIKSCNANNFLRHNRDFKILYDYYILHHDTHNDTTVVPVTFTNKADMAACSKRALELARLDFSAKRINENLQMLLQIDDYLKKNGIRLILLNTPKSECFSREYAKDFDPANITRLKNFLTAHKITYLDYTAMKGLTENDFLDFDHLSYSGSAKICDSIASALTAIKN